MNKILAILSVTILVLSAEAKRVDVRRADQATRIRQNSANLTNGEMKTLRQSGKAIRDAETAFEADGKLSKDEKAQLQTMQNQRSQEINQLSSNDANALPRTVINRRDQNETQRINQGIETNQLTETEVARLSAISQRIENKEAADLANDGHYSPAEEQQIQHMENHRSHVIYKLKHNDQVNSGE